MPASKERPQYFRTIQKINLEYAPVTLTQYESTRTGMRVVVVDQKGPKVNGYFALATEIHDDSGAPHTLEHLCFMGSKNYQYKGLLDKLATRAYSTTNAWTAVEQTAYTLDTAGWDGFAQILPVYLEHVIVPTLTDAGCYTEVHHIDGTGHDAGVVYSEMQGVQNNQEELMELRARRLMYPEGNGFRYETGGMMEQLRVLTADRIREFHKEMYQPKNLCLVLTGEVNHEELLQILNDFEDTIIDDVPSMNAPFKRPWVESKPTPPLTKTILETVEFPEEDESMGEVLVGYLGPHCNDHLSVAALGILLIYLCGSSISVLENTLVEKENLCSMVTYTVETRPDMTVWFTLNAVETDKLQAVHQRLLDVLKETNQKNLDMGYLNDCIKRWRRQIKNRSENAAAFFVDSVIEDHLFGKRDGSDLKEIATLKELDMLEQWSEKQWQEFFAKWIADARHISILGRPSKELSDKITADEQARVEEQKKKLGEDGLKQLAEKLKKAQEQNDKPIPDSVLEKFPVPDTESVHFIQTTTARAGTARKMGKLDNDIQTIIDKDDDGSPLFMHFEHIPSNFVQIKVIYGDDTVPISSKPLIALYMMNLLTTPVTRHGKRIEFEDLVLDLEKETTAFGIGENRANIELLSLAWETEPENYENIISWIRTILFDAIHDPDRILSSLTKILADIPDERRSGNSMASAVNGMIQYKPESNLRASYALSKGPYLKRIKKLLEADEKAVLAQFRELCEALHRPENLRIFVSANIEKLPKPVSAWKPLTAGFDTTKPLAPIVKRKDLLSDVGQSPGSAAYIVPMSTIDSSFAIVTGKCPNTYDHPDNPALMVAGAYMNAVEGPLWVAVRGTGLAYGIGFSRSVDTGLYSLRITRSPDAYKAFAAAKEQVDGYATGKLELNKFALEGAVSELVLGMADEQPTMVSAAAYSFANQVIRGIPKDWSHQMLAKVQAVTPDEIRAAMKKYMVPIFQPESSNLVITCAQIMKDGLHERFSREGYKPEVRALESFQDDSGLEGPLVDEADDDESSDGDEFADTPDSDEDE